ncbi:FtsX-like permease family protein [Kribbella amoyensis]|uniref:FtsX-like permease family protein n=1 Tax=Kribbella amoyensis TaxID=996641 RepID=A0A561BVM0_9ACTN|nr:FtsX-like permease family protein [Kribbella amoyensis]TWD82945.1 FtsX-like permease family protein [Kribbella amoyensis]
MFLRRALRYRWSQAVVLAGVSLLIGTCAAFAPWFSRAVEQTVTTEMLTDRPLVASWQLEALPPASSRAKSGPTAPEKLQELVPADLRPLFSPPVIGEHVDITWVTGPQITAPRIPTRLTWRDGYCERLKLVEGRCPQAPNEVVGSTVDVTNHSIKVGQKFDVVPDQYVGKGVLTVVGLYVPSDALDLYWNGRPPTGHSFPEIGNRFGALDNLMTDRSTFEQNAWGNRSTFDTRPLPELTRVDDLDRLKAASLAVADTAAAPAYNAGNNSGLVGLIDSIDAERRQAATIIPLVMVQVALFGVVVLALALAAVVDQRRPELAVARLRGLSARRTGRAVMLELGVAVTAGMLLGAGTGFGLLLVVRATWLDGGSPLELPWTVPAAVAVALAVGLAVTASTVRSVARQPIATLLRRIVPRRRARTVAIADVAIVVLATAGLVGALTGGGRGPLPVLTPTLLALAVGLTFAHLLLPAAALISRRALRAGRLGLALGALQVSRRPAVTRIVAVVAVATALVSFAGQAASVANDNRQARAGYEAGAAGVLSVNATSLGDFTKALDGLDQERQWLSPVLVARTTAPDSLRTVMIEPDSFRRIAFHGGDLTDSEGFEQLTAPREPAAIELRGERLRVSASTGPMKPVLPKTLDGTPPPKQDPARWVIIQATMVSLRDGGRYVVSFPKLPLVPGRTVDLTATAPGCAGGCRLMRLGIARDLDDQTGIEGEVVLSKFGTERTPNTPLGAAGDWDEIPQLSKDVGSVVAKDGPTGGLTLQITSMGLETVLQHRSAPVRIPALVTSGYPLQEGTTVPALDGLAQLIGPVDRLHGPINRFPERAAVVDLETLRRIGGTVALSNVSFEVWLSAEGLAKADQAIAALGQAGMEARLVDRSAEREAAYGRSASALALQLTPIIGVAGWSLAIIVLLLMVVTSWRSRAQDYASLRITGVPASTTGRAARWEQTGPVTLAVLLGSICGVVGAKVALPLIPLFAETGEPSPIPLDLGTNWAVAGVLWLIGTVVLTTTTVLLGSGVNRRAGYSRIKEELS